MVNRYVLIIFPNVLLAAFLCTHIVGTSIIHTLWGHFINTRYGDINDTHFIGTYAYIAGTSITHTLWGHFMYTRYGDIEHILWGHPLCTSCEDFNYTKTMVI